MSSTVTTTGYAAHRKSSECQHENAQPLMPHHTKVYVYHRAFCPDCAAYFTTSKTRKEYPDHAPHAHRKEGMIERAVSA